jgi:hypothetical protein
LLKSFFAATPFATLDNGHSNFLPPTTITINSTMITFDLYYAHSLHEISIVGNVVSVPEFPAAQILIPIALILSLVVLRRKSIRSR